MEGLLKSREFERLNAKTGIELLWLYVLSSLRKKEMHAYALRKEMEKNFPFRIGNVTTYVVLYKLESRGFVESKKEGNRVVYKMTNKGKKLFELAKSFMKGRYSRIFGKK